jgi:hypothetical protein
VFARNQIEQANEEIHKLKWSIKEEKDENERARTKAKEAMEEKEKEKRKIEVEELSLAWNEERKRENLLMKQINEKSSLIEAKEREYQEK